MTEEYVPLEERGGKLREADYKRIRRIIQEEISAFCKGFIDRLKES